MTRSRTRHARTADLGGNLIVGLVTSIAPERLFGAQGDEVLVRRTWRRLQLAYHAREDVDALGDGVLVDDRVAEDEAAGPGWLIR